LENPAAPNADRGCGADVASELRGGEVSCLDLTSSVGVARQAQLRRLACRKERRSVVLVWPSETVWLALIDYRGSPCSDASPRADERA
jgi:hypothetical protein